jgi:hypothetical protein
MAIVWAGGLLLLQGVGAFGLHGGVASLNRGRWARGVCTTVGLEPALQRTARLTQASDTHKQQHTHVVDTQALDTHPQASDTHKQQHTHVVDTQALDTYTQLQAAGTHKQQHTQVAETHKHRTHTSSNTRTGDVK